MGCAGRLNDMLKQLRLLKRLSSLIKNRRPFDFNAVRHSIVAKFKR
jgi:cytochrome c556